MSQNKLGGKEIWTDPALVVLARNRPEETVLTACKTAETDLGPANGVAACVGLECMTFCELGSGS